jgi:hypothetical protein
LAPASGLVSVSGLDSGSVLKLAAVKATVLATVTATVLVMGLGSGSETEWEQGLVSELAPVLVLVLEQGWEAELALVLVLVVSQCRASLLQQVSVVLHRL